MENSIERTCLCHYLRDLVKEKGLSIEAIAQASGKTINDIERLLAGNESPLLDDIIMIANIAGMKVTIQQSICFAHKKIASQME